MTICLRANERPSLNQFSFWLVADYCVKHQCQNDAKCVNRETNYSCACNSSGWTGKYCEKGFYFVEKVSAKVLVEQVDEGTTLNNKWLSIDINECKEGLDGCHVNAICNNTEGSYNCTCKPGFIGDGQNSCRGKVVIVIFIIIIIIIRIESFTVSFASPSLNVGQRGP